ncbi:MAG: DNA-binding protein [Campylobacter sp.]
MAKVPISEAAEILGITKEAIYNRIRRGTLKCVENDGVKFVIIENEQKKESKTQILTTKSDFNVTEFLLKEVNELKEQNKNLLDDKERLFREKEKILIDAKCEIAKIYDDKDEKLRYFLDMLRRPLIARANGEYITPIDVEFVDDKLPKKWIGLEEFLNSLNLKDKKLKKLKETILKNLGNCNFIKYKDGAIIVKSKKIIKKMIGEKDV